MKFFLHTLDRIRIINGDQEWNGTPAAFQALEPEYPGLPVLTNAPSVMRYQTVEWKYLEDALGVKHPDLFDALPYCDNLADYAVTPPTIYVRGVLSKQLLCASDPNDTIPFTASLRAGPAADAPIIPISAVWPIMLRQKNGLAMDNVLIAFVNGEFSGAYTYCASLPLGEWYVDDQDFTPVTHGETTYQVKLTDPLRFTIYRNL